PAPRVAPSVAPAIYGGLADTNSAAVIAARRAPTLPPTLRSGTGSGSPGSRPCLLAAARTLRPSPRNGRAPPPKLAARIKRRGKGRRRDDKAANQTSRNCAKSDPARSRRRRGRL